jgi:hypothetical protein
VTASYWGLVQAWHGEVDGAVDAVPFELDTEVELAGPVRGHLVFGRDDVAKVLGAFLSNIFDSEVIDDQCEGDRASFVGE